MIGVVFNHNMFDEPYKQSSVEKGLNRLESVCGRLNERLFTSWSNMQRESLYGKDTCDEYIIVHYTNELSAADKTEIADCIKETLTLKKNLYRENELPEILIVFTRVPEEDCFCFNVK